MPETYVAEAWAGGNWALTKTKLYTLLKMPFGFTLRLFSLIVSFSFQIYCTKYWPNGIVPYTITDKFDILQRRHIFDAFDTIEKFTCIRFIPFNGLSTDRYPAQIYIQESELGDGCWSSHTGFTGHRQLVSFEKDVCFEKRTILHELMHVLGFLHEHNRPDRDEHVMIIWDRVIPEKKCAFEKRQFSKDYQIDRMTGYDYQSIMHYTEYAFGVGTMENETNINEIKPTMISKKGIRLGPAETLSPMDVFRLNLVYGCDRI